MDTSKSLLEHYGTENYLPQQACEAILQGDSIPPERVGMVREVRGRAADGFAAKLLPLAEIEAALEGVARKHRRYICAGRNVTGSATADAHCRVTQSGELQKLRHKTVTAHGQHTLPFASRPF